MLVSQATPALGPGWGYMDYSRTWGTPQIDESGEGSAAHFSAPLSERFFFAAAAERLDARYDPPNDNITERFELGSAGIGLHTVERTVQIFGLLNYVEKRRALHAPSGDTHEPAGGVGLAVGARWLVTPYLLVEPQYGLKGYVIDGFTKLDVGVRVLPHVWLLGTFDHGPFSGNEFCAGIRWSWEDYTPSYLPGARLADSKEGGGLVVGRTLIVLRPLTPQLRPAAGAPELSAIAEGLEIVLQESTQNQFGAWWRIGESAWIRETDLLGERVELAPLTD